MRSSGTLKAAPAEGGRGRVEIEGRMRKDRRNDGRSVQELRGGERRIGSKVLGFRG